MPGRRNIWKRDEVLQFIKLIKEKKYLGQLDGKRLKAKEIFKSLETAMRRAGFRRDCISMHAKYKNLKYEHYKEKRHNSIRGNVRREGEFYHELEDLFEDKYDYLSALDNDYGESVRYEHFKTKRHNSIKGNVRREGEFYHELEDLFEDNYESLAATFDPLDYDYEDSFNYSLPLQERLQTNNKSQTSPTSSVGTKQENSNRSTSPHNNEEDKDPDEVCLRWNSHHSNMKSSFPTLLEKEQYVDVTLCSEGQTIRCHRLILSSCSSYFDEILSGITPLQHPVIFLKGTPFWILKSLIDFMYVGEVHIEQAKLQEILEVAELLKIKGLTGKAPSQNSEPKEEPTKKPEKTTPQTPTTQPPKQQRSVPPLRLAVTKEQAASMQTVDPLSLLKPSFYEESTPTKKQPIPIRPKYHHQSLAEFSAKQKEWLSKKITPKKKFKRKSSDHDPSPPPVILRKGTKSRPIVKAPKYYHMEYEEKKEEKLMKCEGEEETENTSTQNTSTPSVLILPISTSTPAPPPEPPTFDISNVKSEPIDMDIEENYVEYDTLPPPASPPTIRITEPRTVAEDESEVFASNPSSPIPDTDKDTAHNGFSPEEEEDKQEDIPEEDMDDKMDENEEEESLVMENAEEESPPTPECDPEPEPETIEDKGLETAEIGDKGGND